MEQVMSVVDRWIEEDYFVSLQIVHDGVYGEEYSAEFVENLSHKVMDDNTCNGVLDVDAVDVYIDELIGV